SVCQPGTYTLIVTASNGCSASDLVMVEEVITQLSETVNQTLCAGECTNVGGMVFCESGTYEINTTTSNGCDSLIQLELEVLPTAMEIATPSLLNCANAMVQLDAGVVSTGPGISYLWTSLDGEIIGNVNAPIVETATPGTYTFTLNNNGCINQQSVTVLQELDTLVVNAGVDLTLDCNTSTQRLTPSIEQLTAPFVVQWTGPEGFVSNERAPMVEIPGIYQIELINTSNGCSATDVLIVNEAPAMQFTSMVERSCSESATGVVIVEGIEWGVAPYQFAIDNGGLQSAPLFESVAVGNHQLQVVDANGCVAESEINVEAWEDFQLDLAPDYPTCGGNPVVVQPLAEIDAEMGTLDYLWSDGSTAAVRQISNPGTYWVEVNNGCSRIRQDFTVTDAYAGLEQQIYQPNAFSPNEDEQNDIFRLESELDFISFQIQIYDRWGNLMFSSNDPKQGWNGHFKGNRASSGVYVWVMQAGVQACNGLEEVVLSGDVTLLR
ncbi:MAG: gliding motility-associated C-terminal domain-containing protein, partial [Bacteroidota bacterium]